MRDRTSDLFYRRSRESGLRITPQRTEIFRELRNAENHPTAEEIHLKVVKTIPNISFDTVNRTLSTFSKIGLVRIVEGYGQAKRYDPDLGAHHHFRCTGCGRIIDFTNPEYDKIPVPADIRARFTVTSKKVVLEGLCAECIQGKTS